MNRVITIAGAGRDAVQQQLAQKEGIFVGISSGATFAGALEVCKGAKGRRAVHAARHRRALSIDAVVQ